ncbi:MAG: AAA family ATPase [Pseudomonadota bacterium]
MAEQDLNTLFLESGGEFYPTPELNQRLNLILYLLENSEQLLFVMAENGHGKTTLLNQVIKGAKENWKIFAPAGSPDLTKTRLMASLLSAFNVRHEGKPEHILYETLRSHIAATHYNSQLPILIVDDAHMLPLETLSLIVDLVMRGEARTRLRVLLFCEPQINSVLTAPEFEIVRNTLTNTLDIPPFSEKQVRTYIQWRLKKAPLISDSAFSNSTFRKIYHESEGVPAAINELAQEVVDEELAESSLAAIPDDFDDEEGDQHTIWVAGIVVLLIVLIFGVYQIKNYLLGIPPESADDKPVLNTLSPPAKDSAESLSLMPEATGISEESRNDELTEEIVVDEDETVLTPEAYDEHDSMPGIKTALWLLKQPSEKYTIQLVGKHTENELQSFIELNRGQLDASQPLASYLTVYPDDKTKDWYVVMYGIFDSYDEANEELAELPASFINVHRSWINKLSGVQKQINEGQ